MREKAVSSENYPEPSNNDQNQNEDPNHKQMRLQVEEELRRLRE